MVKTEIFIIDDDAICRLLLKVKLNKIYEDLTLRQFCNGAMAFNYLKAYFSPTTNYLIFLDINMPIMNGWEFLEKTESYFPTGRFKVYLTSSSIDQQEIKQCERYFSVAKYFSKPIQYEQLENIKLQFKLRGIKCTERLKSS